ncbi:unnamed protein product [Cylindrotheca closterium]|uniref:Arrestin-like N-terminal domain-containing protein n=1 Tax=Cylindrotheca closterium TaxID=2856 RepID=A0AAD2PUB3_9STRA|nr:unnamed protein product [Cylindrotheca closterium]
MGNAVFTTVYLDHETIDEREAVEAGESLSGKVVLDVETDVDPENLYIKLYGREICEIHGRDTSSKDEIIFFQSRLQLYKNTDADQILPNRYVFPFDVPLPTSLPSSLSSDDELITQGSFGIQYTLMVCDETRKRLRYTRTFDIVSAEDADPQPRPCFYQPEPFYAEDIHHDLLGKIYLGAKVSDVNMIHGEELDLALSSRNRSTAYIERIDVALEEEHSWVTDKDEASITLTLAEQQGVDEHVSKLKIDGLEDESQVRDDLRVDEATARRMYQELKHSSSSRFGLATPETAQESFHGSLIQIKHQIKVTVITEIKPEFGYFSFAIPIEIRAKAYDSLEDPPSVYEQDEQDVIFPKASATVDCIIMGRDASMEDWWDYGYKAEETSPSLAGMLDDLTVTLNQHDTIVSKMKDIEWAIFCGSMNPKDFGRVIQHVRFGDLQTIAGILIATAYGGDFTCGHCGAAIANAHQVFRPAMAEALLPFCSDLAHGNEVIRGQLSEFEQIIVALRALGGEEEEEEDDFHNSTSKMPTLRPRARARPSDASAMNGSITPLPDDICMGVEEHQGTVDLLYVIRDIVDSDPTCEFSPDVYRRIRKRVKGKRFLIRPFDELPHYWRVASDREKIAYCGECYDKDRKSAEKAEEGQWGENNDTDESVGTKAWHNDLRDGGNEWVLAMTVHSYSASVYDDDDDEDNRPIPGDICFGKQHHPGNETMKRVIKQNIIEFNGGEWSPEVYQTIKADLRGRRYFVPHEQGGWELATSRQRRTEMGKIYAAEKKALKSEKASSPPTSPVNASGKASINKSGKVISDSPGKSPPKKAGRASFSASMTSMFSKKKKRSKQDRDSAENEVLEFEPDLEPEPQSQQEQEINRAEKPEKPKGRKKGGRKSASSKPEKLEPDDGDVCFGLNNHPGTKALHTAIVNILPQYEDAEWSPAVYKAIRSQIQNAHFFIRTEVDAPWKEASANQRIFRVRTQFELSQKKRRMKIGEEALV